MAMEKLEARTELERVQHELREAQRELEQRGEERLAELDGVNQAFVESQDRFLQIAENIRDVFWLSDLARTNII